MDMMRMNQFVFPGDRHDVLSDMTLTAVIRRMNDARGRSRRPLWLDPKQGNRPVVPHGFRSTFRDWVQEATSFPDGWPRRRWRMQAATRWRPATNAAMHWRSAAN
jgi:integrase